MSDLSPQSGPKRKSSATAPSIEQIAQALRERCGLADSLDQACDDFIAQRQRLRDELAQVRRERDAALAERDEFRRLLRDVIDKHRAATEARERFERLQAEHEAERRRRLLLAEPTPSAASATRCTEH